MNAFQQLMNGHWQVDVSASSTIPHTVGIDAETQRFIALALVAWIAWGVVKAW